MLNISSMHNVLVKHIQHHDILGDHEVILVDKLACAETTKSGLTGLCDRGFNLYSSVQQI